MGLIAIKAVHSVLFFAIGGCLVYFLIAGFARRSDRRAALAGAVVAGEAAIYAVNGMRCPLTDLAEDLGAEDGSVADIYLPGPLRRNLPVITGPMFALALALHARNLVRAGPWPTMDRPDRRSPRCDGS